MSRLASVAFPVYGQPFRFLNADPNLNLLWRWEIKIRIKIAIRRGTRKCENAPPGKLGMTGRVGRVRKEAWLQS
jgi:hypothetical protein